MNAGYSDKGILMVFDIKTLVLISFMVGIINVLAMTIIWSQYRKRFAGISFWLAYMILHASGIGLILLRGMIPDFISISLSNSLIIAGSVFLLIGLESFVGRKGPRVHNYILIFMFFFLYTHYGIINPDIMLRGLIISAAIITFALQISWLLLYRVPAELLNITRFTGLIVGGFALISITRFVLHIFFPADTNDFFRAGFIDSMALSVFLSLHICLTISLILMVTRRLLGEVQLQEEKYTKAFHSSPYAILLTKYPGGRILEVNDGFLKTSGYQNSEVIGKTITELGILVNSDDVKNITQGLSASDTIHELEINARKKSSETITGLLSSDIIIINNEKCVLSSFSDITGRKEDEKKIRNLLHEKELILKEVHHRIKNNMNTIKALLILQGYKQDTLLCTDILNDAANRVQSMMTLYDKLYRSDNYRELNIREFLPALVAEITGLFRDSVTLATEIDVQDFILGVEVLTPVGIIINELITNSMKYAFTGRENGCIYLSALKIGNTVTIIYRDNGIGLPEEVTFKNTTGFGLQLIAMLVDQIRGSIMIDRNNGTEYKITLEA